MSDIERADEPFLTVDDALDIRAMTQEKRANESAEDAAVRHLHLAVIWRAFLDAFLDPDGRTPAELADRAEAIEWFGDREAVEFICDLADVDTDDILNAFRAGLKSPGTRDEIRKQLNRVFG